MLAADITAEQLFNMFFNGAFPTRQGPMTNPYYTRSFSRRWPPESDNDNHQQQVTVFIMNQLFILFFKLIALYFFIPNIFLIHHYLATK